MKHLRTNFLCAGLLLTMMNASFGADLSTQENSFFRANEWVAASDEQLDDLRGGFETSAGLSVSFGIVRTVMLNGEVVNSTSFNLPDIANITDAQARIASTAIAEAGIVQNGAGNFLDAGIKAQFATSTLIQNTLNDQAIQTLTVINAGVNSLALLKTINTQTILRDALLSSLTGQ